MGATLTQSELNTQGGNSVAAIPTKILDEPNLDLRTEVAEGLCKLLMIGSINTPKLLSRLLLILYDPMTESKSKLKHILGTFFPLYSSMSKPRQLTMDTAFIPTMKVLFDAPVTSPLSEIDTEDVGMFFVHLTREDMLQSYDPNKKNTKILESSSNTVHNSYAHLKEVKMLAELLLQNVKEKSCVRSQERLEKQLDDWLAKDPATSGDGSITPTMGKKRILFSQSMIGNPLLNPESVQVFETTSEENILSGTRVEEESFSISHVMLGDNTTTSSHQPKKMAGDGSVIKSSKTAQKNLTYISDDFLEYTPLARTRRAQTATARPDNGLLLENKFLLQQSSCLNVESASVTLTQTVVAIQTCSRSYGSHLSTLTSLLTMAHDGLPLAYTG